VEAEGASRREPAGDRSHGTVRSDQAHQLGPHRWAFKPEFGYSQRWGNWILDGYAGVWLYTTNSAYYNIPASQRRRRPQSAAWRVT
jgi:hypothetical protein